MLRCNSRYITPFFNESSTRIRRGYSIPPLRAPKHLGQGLRENSGELFKKEDESPLELWPRVNTNCKAYVLKRLSHWLIDASPTIADFSKTKNQGVITRYRNSAVT